MKSLGEYLLSFTVLLLSQARLEADIFYSGPQNIVIRGPAPGIFGSRTIDLHGDTVNTWDNLNIGLIFGTDPFPFSFGGPTAHPGAPCTLGHDANPYIVRYEYGALPDLTFGAGTIELWDYHHSTPTSDGGHFRNATGYAALLVGDFSTPRSYGWVQLSVSDYNLTTAPGPTITLIDWAFDTTPGNVLFMGQVPEPSITALLGVGGLAVVTRLLFRRCKPGSKEKGVSP